MSELEKSFPNLKIITLNELKGGTKTMAQRTLKEEAKAYEPKRTLNIADLDRVDLSYPIEDRTGKKTNDKGEEETFEYKVMVANNQDYRVPATVLEEIQKILKLKPETKAVKVNKKGSGFTTTYDVEYLD